MRITKYFIIATLLLPLASYAVIFQPIQGGTGTSTVGTNKFLFGNGTSPFLSTSSPTFNYFTITGNATSTVGSVNGATGGIEITSGGLKISTLKGCDTIDTTAAGVLVCGSDSTGSASAFPFTNNTWGESTTSVIGLLGGFVSSGASSSISDLLHLNGSVNASSTFHVSGNSIFNTITASGLSSLAGANLTGVLNASSTAHVTGAFGVGGLSTLAGINASGVINGSSTLHALGITGSALRITGLDCTGNTNGGALTASATGVVSCTDDDSGGAATATSTKHYWDVEKLLSSTLRATSTALTFWQGGLQRGSFDTSGNFNTSGAINASSTLHVTGAATFGGAITGLTGTAPITYTPSTATIALSTPLALTYGGLGFNSVLAKGQLVYSSGVDVLTTLPAGTRGNILAMTTTGIPGWISTSTFAHLSANNIFSGLNSFTNTGSTTFKGGIDIFESLKVGRNGTSTINGNATSTLTGGLIINGGGLKIGTLDCNGTQTVDAVAGVLVCGADATGAGGSATSTFHYFDVERTLTKSVRSTSTALTFWTNGSQWMSLDTNGSLNASTTSVHITGPFSQDHGSVLFKGGYFTGLPVGGAGDRFEWIEGQSALRFGEVSGTQWDDGNIGFGSLAFGVDSKASGAKSFAGGISALASKAAAFAFGNSPTASGVNSVAIGETPIASGDNSVALGDFPTSSGSPSFAFGDQVTAGGSDSTALGFNTNASVDFSIAIGRGFNQANPLLNNQSNSIYFGMLSTVPTLAITGASGIGTYGAVGIASSTPWGTLSVEQKPSQTIQKPTFVVSDTGTSSPFLFVNQKGGVSLGTNNTTLPYGHLIISGSLNASSTAHITGNVYLDALDCSGNTNGGAITAAASGLLSCSNDDSGGASSATSTFHYFDVERVLAKSLSATSTDLTLRTFGTGNVIRSVQSLNASSTLHADSNGSILGKLSVGTSSAYDLTRNLAVEGNGIITGTLRVGPIIGTSTLNLAGIITDTSAATSSFSGAIAAAIGGLSSSHGLVISGGQLVMPTNTSGNILVADGTGFKSVAMGTDATISSSGALTIANNAVNGAKIALGSDATGDIMYYNGTDYVRLAAGTRGNILELTTSGIPGWISTSTLADLRATNAFTSTGTTTFSGGVSAAALASSHGLTLTGGIITSSAHLIADVPSTKGFGFSTTTPWGRFAIEQPLGASLGLLQPIFSIADTGTSTPWQVINQHGWAGFGTSTPQAQFTIEQLPGSYFSSTLKNIFSVGDTGTTSPFMSITQKGQILFNTTTQSGIGTTTAGTVFIAAPLIVDTGKNGSSTVVQIGDVGTRACLQIRDIDNNGWSYCRVKSGVFTCSTVSCK